MRLVFVAIHRWAGLFTAVFLFLAGLTGALIAWDHELDEALNPELFRRASAGAPRSAFELADQVERDEPRLQVRYLPLHAEPGHTQFMAVGGRVDPSTREPYQLGYDQLFVDPGNGRRQGERTWGDASLERKSWMPFLYRLHYTLHLPMAGGLELGVLLMGVVAIVWAIDALVALYISFPSLASWRKSLAFRLRAGGYKLTFDLHRSGGVWLWLLLFPFAITAVSMNLGDQVVKPLVEVFSTTTPSPFDGPEPTAHHEPELARRAVVELAQREAERRGLTTPAGGIFYVPSRNLYGVGFFEPGQEHGDGGLGNTWLYYDGDSGRLVQADQPGVGSAGDLFMQLQFPLHSGRILGLTGRILVTVLGLAIALLSATGVLIWARKRKAQRARHVAGGEGLASGLLARSHAPEV